MNLALVQIGGSLVAILALAGIARWLQLGEDVRLRDKDEARALAQAAVCGFDPVEIALGTVTLDLGAEAGVWAASLRRLGER